MLRARRCLKPTQIRLCNTTWHWLYCEEAKLPRLWPQPGSSCSSSPGAGRELQEPAPGAGGGPAAFPTSGMQNPPPEWEFIVKVPFGWMACAVPLGTSSFPWRDTSVLVGNPLRREGLGERAGGGFAILPSPRAPGRGLLVAALWVGGLGAQKEAGMALETRGHHLCSWTDYVRVRACSSDSGFSSANLP